MAPLTPDRLMEGRPFAARDSRLFKLPLEILSMIVRYLDGDKHSLASLAQVNSDCRQLARSCQFQTIVFNSSPSSTHLLGILIYEAAERSRSPNRLTGRLSLGACIRCVKTNATYYKDQIRSLRARDRFRDEDVSEFDEELIAEGDRIEAEQWQKKARDMSVSRTRAYEPGLAFVISTLPHLDRIEWVAGTMIDTPLLNCLAASRARHLCLYGQINLDSVALSTKSWPLETLDINIEWEWGVFQDRESLDSSSLWRSLAQACSSTLKRLNIDHSRYSEANPERNKDKPVQFTAEFPRLESLHIVSETALCPSSLRSLLQSNQLSTISIPMCYSTSMECLDDMGPNEALQTLVLTGYSLPPKVPLRVFQDNPQLTAVGVRYGAPPAVLEPLISALGALSNLKTLSLQWNGTMIPESSLFALSSLVTLEQLHITSGNNGGWKHDWFVDHDHIRSNLFPLRKLKKLALTRDTYRIDNGEVPEGYYSFRTPTMHDWETLERVVQENVPRMPKSVWELSHLARMKLQADEYAKTFRKLAWIHLGQLSFPITADGPHGKRTALFPDRSRDPDFSVMKELFGMESDGSYEPFLSFPPMIID
ncbi:hypothetical protein BJY00DRAFT_65079 [Aspergillus carlsbadensis]|nr:hypothetical protein BJY00DRAFT_65079 [Aspergillus carlsbadensis]